MQDVQLQLPDVIKIFLAVNRPAAHSKGSQRNGSAGCRCDWLWGTNLWDQVTGVRWIVVITAVNSVDSFYNEQ